MKAALNRIASAFKLSRRPLSYDEEKQLARDADMAVRAKLAGREDVRPEILYYLAEDPAPEVRRKIASNANSPRHADLILARDGDDVVRSDVAGKIAQLAPGLSADEQEQVRRMTYQILEILARDQLPRVRRILAETLKDMSNAPHEIIGKLARDTDIDVAGPVLRSSPVLTDEDLIEIIRTCPIAGPVAEISRRANVGEKVTDAIIDTDDVEAIGTLLANPSAQIREEALDRIIDRAPEIESWHEPLARRPKLSSMAVTKIARFVADSLIEVMHARGDIDPSTVAVLKSELSNRLDRDSSNRKTDDKTGAKDDGHSEGNFDSLPEAAIARARRLYTQGKLKEDAVSEALAAGDRRFVAAALAVLSGLPLALVEKVAESKSARGVVAICWKANLAMRFATQLQIRYAHIAPNAAINPADGEKYPLTPEEMDWQIDFFGTMVPGEAEAKPPLRSRA